MEALALTIAGVVTPFVVSGIKKLFKLSSYWTNLITAVVVAVIASAVAVILTSTEGNLLVKIGYVFGVSAVVYQAIVKTLLDKE